MGSRRPRFAVLVLVLAGLVLAPPAVASRNAGIAALQVALRARGLYAGTIDGVKGRATTQAVKRFQGRAGLPADGVARASTFAALRQPPATCSLPLAWPIDAPIGDPFGPRGNRFHAGIDLLAPRGTPIRAAAPGRVVLVGYAAGGWGKLVVIAHTGGVKTMYAHLSKVIARRGQSVVTGTRIGLVGATGDASGPHLHFEVRLRGAAVDPLTALP